MEKIDVREYGILPEAEDRHNTLRLQRLLEGLKGKEAELLFEKGRYHFFPDYASEKTLCISNHDEDTLKRIAFDMEGLSNIRIRGQGSAFVFHTEILCFYIHGCENIELEGFSINYGRPVYSEGEIVRREGQRMAIRVDREKYPCEVKNGRLLFFGENFCEECQCWMAVDPEKKIPAGGLEFWYGRKPAGGYGSWRETEDGLLEVDMKKEFCRLDGYEPGQTLVLRHHPRSYPAVYIADSRNVTLREITIYHCAGMGVLAQFTENILLERVRVTPDPDGGHWFSLAADATHFVYCRGRIHMKECLFEQQLDDATNVHGIYSRIREVPGSRELIVELVHHQHKGVPVGAPGDRISFVRYTTMLSAGEGILEEVKQLNRDFTYLRFRDPLPELEEKDVVENISYVPDVCIEGCTVRNNRARGFLLTSAGNVEVQNNHFCTSGAAVLISGDASEWFESGETRHIVIRNNLFDHCDYIKKWGQAVIQANTPVRAVLLQEKLHKYLEIRGNTFLSDDGEILDLQNIEKVIFAGNRIKSPKSGKECFRLEHVTDFIEEDNLWEKQEREKA